KFTDFPFHQDLVQYFLMVNAHEQTAAEAKQYASTLEEKNRSLNYRDRLFNSLMENLPSGGAILLRQDGRVLIANGKDLPCKKYDKFSEKGVPLEELFGPRASEIQSYMEGEIGLDGRFDYETERSVYRCAMSYLPHPESHRSRWLVIFQNVTEDLRLQAQAERLQRLDSVGHLAGGIAHDFNNYLASILGNISVAKDNPELRAEELEDAEAACFASRQLTRQLLTFSKGGDPVRTVGKIEPVVEDAVKFSLSGSDITWEIESDPDLWQSNFDSGQISQILNNLCVNASQAMAGHGHLSIALHNVEVEETTILEDGHYVRIDVKDNGPGILPDVLAKIWDPYFTTKKEGSGLGLATCHSIAENHGGTITVESELSKGATFSLWLPAEECEVRQRRRSRSIDRNSLPSYRILILDDQAPIRIVASRILEKLNQQVVAVDDGVDAVGQYQNALAEGQPFDIVALDMTIPGGMGGMETLARIKQIDPDVYAVVCYGYTNENNLDQYQEAGFSSSLAKPFTAKEVEGMVKDYYDSTCLVS
ncbi:MAG: ATP-binding protein, partial [Verrucomicrobiota bacterium]